MSKTLSRLVIGLGLATLLVLPLGLSHLGFVHVAHAQQLQTSDLLNSNFGDTAGLGQADFGEQTGLGPADLKTTTGNLIRIILGFLGIVAVLGILVCTPLGIYFLAKQDPVEGKHDERSGKGPSSVIPEEIKGWSWGGFVFMWLWGVSNSVWLSLLCFVPFVGFIMRFVLGAKGKEWAWQERKWASVEEFNRVQNIWDKIGFVLFCIWLAIFIIWFVIMMGNIFN